MVQSQTLSFVNGIGLKKSQPEKSDDDDELSDN
jgi:hypothetical protein